MPSRQRVSASPRAETLAHPRSLRRPLRPESDRMCCQLARSLPSPNPHVALDTLGLAKDTDTVHTRETIKCMRPPTRPRSRDRGSEEKSTPPRRGLRLGFNEARRVTDLRVAGPQVKCKVILEKFTPPLELRLVKRYPLVKSTQGRIEVDRPRRRFPALSSRQLRLGRGWTLPSVTNVSHDEELSVERTKCPSLQEQGCS